MRVWRMLISLALLVVAGCATLPTGPSVRVLPGPGKTLDQFQVDDYACRDWAERRIGMNPQEAANRTTFSSAAVGTAVGAGVGAALGAVAGSPGAGAAIGGGSGLLFGSSAGAESGRVYGMEAQQRYDNSYVQCMYSKGNLVPGVGVVVQPPSYPVPPDYRPAP